MAFIIFLDGEPYGYYETEDEAHSDAADLEGDIEIVEDDGEMS